MIRKVLIGLFMVMFAPLVLAGCSDPEPISDSTINRPEYTGDKELIVTDRFEPSGAPAQNSSEFPLGELAPSLDAATIYFQGSSTCPPKIDDVTYSDDEKELRVDLIQTDQGMCTMDLRLYAQQVKTQNGEAFPTDMSIIVRQ